MRAVITGAASGIGRAVAERLMAGDLVAGDHRMLLVDRDADNLRAAAAPFGGAAATLVAFRVTSRLRAAASPTGTAPAARATAPAHR